MAYPTQSARFADILLRTQEVLAARLGLPIEMVPIVKGGKYPIPAIGEYHCAIRPLSGAINGEIGSGRYALPIKRLIAIDISVRSAVDELSSDSAILTEPDFGLFDREEAVLDALCVRPLLDASGTALLIEPMHPTQPTSDPDANQEDRSVGWVRSTIYLECFYIAKLGKTPV